MVFYYYLTGKVIIDVASKVLSSKILWKIKLERLKGDRSVPIN
jgi:hypothetical protein